MPWGEQAALLRIEEQECAIDELRATNEVGSLHAVGCGRQ